MQTHGFISLFRILLLAAGRCAPEALPLQAQTNCAQVPSGLLSWWRAEGNAFDEVGLAHGTNVGNATFGPGRVGQAFVFDGLDDAVNVGNPAGLQLQNFTLEGWIRRAHPSRATQGAQSSGLIFSGSTGAYGFGLLDDGRLFLTKVGVSAVFSTVAITDTNAFHHVAVTKSGSTVLVYVDGVGESVGPYDPGFTFSGPMAIGARGGDYVGGFFRAVDEWSIYNRALGAAEIQALYSAGSTGKCVTAVVPTIVVQPTNQTVVVGTSVSFHVVATGTPPLSYPWRFEGTNVVGATASTLTLLNIQTNQAGAYSVIVSNVAGIGISSNAVLTVLAGPACVPQPLGIVSWWRAEGNHFDAAGTNHGVNVGNTTFGPGRVGAAFLFDGAGDGVDVGPAQNLRLQNFTVEAWIRRFHPSRATQGPQTSAVIFWGTEPLVWLCNLG